MVSFDTRVSVEDMNPVSGPTFTRDSDDRITQIVVDYTTIRITYNIGWVGSTKEIDASAFSRTVTER